MNRLPIMPLLLVVLVIAAGVYFSVGRRETAPAPVTPAGWPLSITGQLACSGNAVTVTATNGTVYALNGNAIGKAERNGWHLAQEVQTGDVGPLISQGLTLCN